MTETDFAYFTRRASEELVAAVNAQSVVAAQVHRDLADRFRRKAEELRPIAQAQTVNAA